MVDLLRNRRNNEAFSGKTIAGAERQTFTRFSLLVKSLQSWSSCNSLLKG